MDIEKLIEQLRTESLYTDKASLEIMDLCMDAATALSALQAENEKLRTDLEYEREHMNAYHDECGQWEAENAQLRKELEWKDKVIQLAQREERKAKAELEQVKADRSRALDDVPDPIAADERQTSPGRQWDWLMSRFTWREQDG